MNLSILRFWYLMGILEPIPNRYRETIVCTCLWMNKWRPSREPGQRLCGPREEDFAYPSPLIANNPG